MEYNVDRKIRFSRICVRQSFGQPSVAFCHLISSERATYGTPKYHTLEYGDK